MAPGRTLLFRDDRNHIRRQPREYIFSKCSHTYYIMKYNTTRYTLCATRIVLLEIFASSGASPEIVFARAHTKADGQQKSRPTFNICAVGAKLSVGYVCTIFMHFSLCSSPIWEEQVILDGAKSLAWWPWNSFFLINVGHAVPSWEQYATPNTRGEHYFMWSLYKLNAFDIGRRTW